MNENIKIVHRLLSKDNPIPGWFIKDTSIKTHWADSSARQFWRDDNGDIIMFDEKEDAEKYIEDKNETLSKM